MLSELTSDLRYRLRAIFRRGALERELDDELHFHIEQETAKNIAAGMTPAEAARRARVALGGVERTKEESRDARGVSVVEHVFQDLRYAARGLRTQPAFTLAVVVTLALGIGVNAVMFGIVDRLIFRPPSFMTSPETAHRVYLMFTPPRGEERRDRNTEYTRFRDLQKWTTAFSTVAAFDTRKIAVGSGEDSRELPIATISANLFEFFDVQPVLGRFFRPDEDSVPAGAPVVVLSHGLWKTRFGARADVLGEPLQIGRATFTVIGVAPEGFEAVPDDTPPAAFIPITSYAGLIRDGGSFTGYYTNYNWGWLQVLVRRKPGVSLAAADADLTSAYRRSYAAEGVLSPGQRSIELAKPRAIAGPVQANRGPGAARESKILGWIGGVAVIVLLIACANVSNLQIARALRRRREVALRLALGVSRGRLVSQFLTESMLLAILSGVVGLVVAQWGAHILRPIFLAGQPTLRVWNDPRTVIFASLVVLAAGILTGLAPALHARRADLAAAMKAGAREGGYQRSRIRTGLLVVQGALAVVLLVGAGLFTRSLNNVRSMRLGYDVDPVLYVSRNLRGLKLTKPELQVLGQRLRAEAAAIPGVQSAALGLTVPFWDTWSERLSVPGIDSVSRLGSFTIQAASKEYFQTVGTRILRGRGIEDSDRAGSAPVVVVSENMARALWPGDDAIGKCIRVGADTSPCASVVGIAENIKQNSLTEDKGLHYFLPIEQFHPEDAAIFIRVRGDAAAQAEPIRRRLQTVMPGSAYVTVTPMREILDPAELGWRAGATMFGAFSLLALVVAAIGLYSVIAYDVAQRLHELGVRIALGARVGDVIRLVIGSGIRFAVAGIVIGSLMALASGKWVAPLLFDVSPRDPLVYASVVAMLLMVATIASAFPAFRATRVDPARALRAE